jgi:hypothetical protein
MGGGVERGKGKEYGERRGSIKGCEGREGFIVCFWTLLACSDMKVVHVPFRKTIFVVACSLSLSIECRPQIKITGKHIRIPLVEVI